MFQESHAFDLRELDQQSEKALNDLKVCCLSEHDKFSSSKFNNLIGSFQESQSQIHQNMVENFDESVRDLKVRNISF